VTPTACINDFEYFLIDSQKGVNGYAGLSEPVDGILGMSRDLVPKGTKYEVGPLLVKNLKDKGLTQYNVFSFYLTDPDKQSFIDFNGYVRNFIKDDADDKIIWLKLNDDFYWSSMCQGISYGPQGKDNAFAWGANKHSQAGTIFSIFDTGTSFTLVPKSYFVPFT